MLRFFRSAAVSVETLYQRIIFLIVLHCQIKKANNRIVLLADRLKISKEGLRMACVGKTRQEPQNSGKPEYIEGHTFGVVSMVGEKGGGIISIPVMAAIHESKTKTHGESM
jgi:hypothetical protein